MFILSPIFCRLGTGHHCRNRLYLPQIVSYKPLRETRYVRSAKLHFRLNVSIIDTVKNRVLLQSEIGVLRNRNCRFLRKKTLANATYNHLVFNVFSKRMLSG